MLCDSSNSISLMAVPCFWSERSNEFEKRGCETALQATNRCAFFAAHFGWLGPTELHKAMIPR